MKRILFCASTVSHINNFHLPYLKAFHDMGYEVHVATNAAEPIKWADKVFKIPFRKSFISLKNINALIQTRKLLTEGKYDKISSNTTLAGLIVRLSALFMKDRPRIYHIVHGYHFSLNSGIRKFIYLIPEKIAASVSDVVMVMNREDYKIAADYRLYRNKLFFIDGIGVDLSKFKPGSCMEKVEIKRQMGYSDDYRLFAYAAEFSKRKNHELLIRAFAECNLPKAVLLLAGDGITIGKCRELAEKLNQTEKIVFLGYVNDVPRLYHACDAVVTVSRSEGLPFNVVEAMGCGLPIIASNIKGHRELVEDEKNGLLFDSGNMQQLVSCIKSLYFVNQKIIYEYGNKGLEIAERYSLKHVKPKVMECYLS